MAGIVKLWNLSKPGDEYLVLDLDYLFLRTLEALEAVVIGLQRDDVLSNFGLIPVSLLLLTDAMIFGHYEPRVSFDVLL